MSIIHYETFHGMADPSVKCFQHMKSFQPKEIMTEPQMKIKSYKTKKDIKPYDAREEICYTELKLHNCLWRLYYCLPQIMYKSL